MTPHIGDVVIYSGETVRVVATPHTTHNGDPQYYLVEGYSVGWYPSPGVKPRGNYGVTQGKKYFWVIDPTHLTPVPKTFATTGGSSLTAADIKPGRYRVLSTKNVRNYEHNHHGKVVGQIVKITAKDIEQLSRNDTFTIEDNRWGTNFAPSDFEWVGEPELLTATPHTKYKIGERVIYEGAEAVIARANSDETYVIQVFGGNKGWEPGTGNSDLLPGRKYWAVSGRELEPSPIQTKIPDGSYHVKKFSSPRMIDPVHYGYGSFGSAGMMASMVDPYYDKHRSERTLLADMERDYQRQRAKRYYEKAASLGMYFHTGNNNVLLSDLVEKKSDKPVTNQPPDAYIQQPIIVTKRKTKHSLTTV